MDEWTVYYYKSFGDGVPKCANFFTIMEEKKQYNDTYWKLFESYSELIDVSSG